MPESGPSGSVRGALSNGRPYRDYTKVLIRVSTLLGRRFVKTARWEDGRMASVTLGPASKAVDFVPTDRSDKAAQVQDRGEGCP
jgi:hypothetical protein